MRRAHDPNSLSRRRLLPADASSEPIDRLSPADLTNLAAETVNTPMHIGLVAVLDGRPLCDARGTPQLAAMRSQINHNLRLVPQLRRRLYRPGPLAGRALWVDDPDFRIDRHVEHTTIGPAADEAALLRLTERLLRHRLDRAHPMWRIWFVTGFPDGQIAAVIALHHAIADGLAAVQLLTTLLGPPADARVGDDPRRHPVPAPGWLPLVIDNVGGRLAMARRRIRRPSPREVTSWTRRTWRTLRASRGAPQTSLNLPIGPRRRVAVLRTNLESVREAAHRHGATVNDVVLDLVAGGLRALLESRAEPVDRVALHAAVPMSGPSSQRPVDGGNRSGIVVVRLPLGEPDPVPRLEAVHAEATAAKDAWSAAAGSSMLSWLARSGLMRVVTRRQRLTNVVVNNVIGPSTTIRLLSAPVLDVIPVGVLAGNLAICFLALSYRGRLTVTVRADADRFPDLDVLVDAITCDWQRLHEQPHVCLDPAPKR